MAKVIGGVDIERTYSFDEIMQMRRDGRLKPIALQGYVVRAEGGRIGFVPWYESVAAKRKAAGGARTFDITADVDQMRQDVEAEHPMRRRTAQERVASMVVRLMEEAKRNGTIAGLTDEQIRTITGEYWKSGETAVTTEMVRRVAAHFLGVAELQTREQESKRTTRLHQFA